jgi:hypothetical protein
MDFLKDLHEARMTRNENNVKVLSYTDCTERLYLSLLVLELLRQYENYKPAAQRYAKKTTVYTGYDRFSMSSTDLYNFIYFVTGDKEAIDKLKDPEAAWEQREQTTLPTMAVNRYLTKIANNTTPEQVSSFFMKVESSLGIKNTQYKTVRRDMIAYKKLDHRARQNLVSVLLLACRAKLRNSDIIDDLEKLAADRNLETGRVADNEPTVSVPDISMKGTDLALYRYVVGANNLHMTKQFVEHVKHGKATNSAMNQAYLPAVKMLDDIITAGPAYIQQLRALHKRAKKGRK